MGRFAIVCDIDGVVVKGVSLVARSRDAVRRMLPHPFVFVTNDGICSERAKAQQLSSLLEFTVPERRFLMAHSPLQHYKHLKERRVLVVARDYTIAREICRDYGLENVVFLPEYIAANPHLIPAISHTPNVANLQSSPSVEMNETALHTETLYRTPIDAVVILSLPVEWSDSLQVLVDVLRTSNGVPDKANELGADEPQHVELYCANPDLEYSDRHNVPRYTVGAYLLCLQSLYHASTHRELQVVLLGKPHALTFEFARERLAQEFGTPMLPPLQAPELDGDTTTFYMIGDNPRSDIRGANAAGREWFSILVRTGCFSSGAENDATYPANHVCNDLHDAIDFILEREQQPLFAPVGTGTASHPTTK